MTKAYARNIPLLYVYSVLIKRVSMPIIVLYFLLNNLNYTQIGILAATMSLITLTTEIHGGIFADTRGKKYSLMLASFFALMTMFFYWVGDSFIYFFIASVLYGFSGTFITGTRNALLYDTLIQMDRTEDFKKYSSRVLLYSHLFNALILLVIPVIYAQNPKLPFLIGMLFFLLSFVLSFFFIEPPRKDENNKRNVSYGETFKRAVREIIHHRILLPLLVYSMLVLGFLFASDSFIQPLLTISGLDVVYFGIVYAAMRVVQGIGGVIAHRLEKYLSTVLLLLLSLVIGILGLLGYAYGFGWIIIVSVLLIKTTQGLHRIVMEDEINRNIGSENRTTILSIESLMQSLITAAFVFVSGLLADVFGVQQMFLFVLVAFILCSSISLLSVHRKST